MHVLLGPLRTRPQPAGLGTPGAGGTRPWDASGSCLPPPPLLPRWPWLPGDNRHRPDRLTLASPDLDPSGRNYRGWQTEEECGRGLKSRWVTDPHHKRSPVRRRPWRPAWQPPPGSPRRLRGVRPALQPFPAQRDTPRRLRFGPEAPRGVSAPAHPGDSGDAGAGRVCDGPRTQGWRRSFAAGLLETAPPGPCRSACPLWADKEMTHLGTWPPEGPSTLCSAGR